MTVKLNSFSNKDLSLNHAGMAADTLAEIFNIMMEAGKEMSDAEFDSAVTDKAFEQTFWKIYNKISFLETDKHRHPHNEYRDKLREHPLI